MRVLCHRCASLAKRRMSYRASSKLANEAGEQRLDWSTTYAAGPMASADSRPEVASDLVHGGRSTAAPALVTKLSPTAVPDLASNIWYSSHPSRSGGGIGCPGGTKPASKQGTLVSWNSHTSRPGDPTGARPGRDHQANVTGIGFELVIARS